jgi:hypothetical protein
MRRPRVETVLLWSVYAAIAIATFRHTAWGFGTLETTLLAPILTRSGAVFWITGGLSAAALDAGLAGTVLAIQLRARRGNPTRGLFFLIAFVAAMATMTQLLYAVTHAVPTEQVIINVAPKLQPFAQALWDYRVLVLPALLPGLSVAYAFVARDTATRREWKERPITDFSKVDLTPKLYGELKEELEKAAAGEAKASEPWSLEGEPPPVLKPIRRTRPLPTPREGTPIKPRKPLETTPSGLHAPFPAGLTESNVVDPRA